MTKYLHIVQVHPIELGEPNLYKVEWEREFDTKEDAEYYIQWCDDNIDSIGNDFIDPLKAVYHGRVNDATGELE